MNETSRNQGWAITGAAGGVMRGAEGLLRGFGCAALTGAGRATIGRFI